MGVTTAQDRQIINELSLLEYNKVFTKLTRSQKNKVVHEFLLMKMKLRPGQEEAYLSQKMFYKKRKRKKKESTLEQMDKFFRSAVK